jgi:hypothetical protein
MSTEKGILTSELESKLAVMLDDAVKLTGILEAVDGMAFKIVITAIDNNVADKIPEPYKTTIAELLVDILQEQDYEAACNKAAMFLDTLIDIPGLDDPTEAMIFQGIFTVIAGLLAKIGTDGNV